MGRKSKLTDQQWAEIQRRLLEGEVARKLAKEFGISESSLRGKISAQTAQIKTVANQIVSAERALSELPISAQITAQNFASKLRSIYSNMASAADHSAANAHRLSAMANAQMQVVDETDLTSEESQSALKAVAGLTAMANEALKPAFNMLNANKDAAAKVIEDAESDITQNITPAQLSDAVRKVRGQF